MWFSCFSLNLFPGGLWSANGTIVIPPGDRDLSAIRLCAYALGEGESSQAFLAQAAPTGEGQFPGEGELYVPSSWGMDVPGRYGGLGERQQSLLQRLLRQRCSQRDDPSVWITEPLILISSLKTQNSCKEGGMRRNCPFPESLTFLGLAWDPGSILSRAP